MEKDEKGQEYQKGGCGGFGKGNFSQLFKSIEDYEKSLEAKQAAVWDTLYHGTKIKKSVFFVTLDMQIFMSYNRWIWRDDAMMGVIDGTHQILMMHYLRLCCTSLHENNEGQYEA